jgi:hypothetical protein
MDAEQLLRLQKHLDELERNLPQTAFRKTLPTENDTDSVTRTSISGRTPTAMAHVACGMSLMRKHTVELVRQI